MAIAVNDLRDEVAADLRDTSKVTWTNDDLLEYLNDGQRMIALLAPQAAVQVENLQLAAGVSQALTAPDHRLLNITHNMGTDGNTPGRAVRHADMADMDATAPNWRGETASAEVVCYMTDADAPSRFWVYPPQPSVSPGYVQVVVSTTPTNASAGGNISLADIYAPALREWMLYRAKSAEDEAAGGEPHWQRFMQIISAHTGHDMTKAPDASAPPYSKEAAQR